MGLGKILVMRAGVCERQEKKGAGKAGNRKSHNMAQHLILEKAKKRPEKIKKGR